MPENRNLKRAAVTVFFVVLSIALVILLVRQITLSDIQRLAGQLTAAQFLLLSGLYLLMAYSRGIRLGYVIQDPNHARLTSIAAIHAFLNHILPFRMGELSLPFLIKGFTARGLASGSLSLVVIRLYDAVSIALLSVVSLLVVGSEFAPSARHAMWASSILVVIVFLLVFRHLEFALTIFGGAACRCLRWLGRAGKGAADRVEQAVQRMVADIRALDTRQKFIFLPASSVAVTVINYTLFYCTMVFMGIDIGFFKNMLASLGELVTTFLPNTLGSFGTMEAGWAAGYMLCGVSKADAIATGFIMHGIILLSGFAISGCGLVYLLLERRRASSLKKP